MIGRSGNTMSQTRWKKIIAVVTDPFAKTQPAATKAAALARRVGARVTLLNVFMLPQPVSTATSTKALIATAVRERKQRLTAIARQLGLQAPQTIVQWDFPVHAGIVRQVVRTSPDLVVAETHREGRIARLILANTDWELIRSCPCPIWFVRRPTLPRAPRLLVAVDPTHARAKPARLDDRLLSVARDVTRQVGGTISIAHAEESTAGTLISTLLWGLPDQKRAARTREIMESRRVVIAEIASRYEVPAARCYVQAGSAREVIPAAVRQSRADLLVMGAVSRSAPGTPVIGGTAEHVIDRVECDLLIIKPAGHDTPARRASSRGTRA
jgi:universal stress protein E